MVRCDRSGDTDHEDVCRLGSDAGLEPTASLDTERAFQVVETFANLIHENNRAGIMVTHDLRMCKYVDRVLQMRDGKLVQIYETEDEVMALAKGGDH